MFLLFSFSCETLLKKLDTIVLENILKMLFMIILNKKSLKLSSILHNADSIMVQMIAILTVMIINPNKLNCCLNNMK